MRVCRELKERADAGVVGGDAFHDNGRHANVHMNTGRQPKLFK